MSSVICDMCQPGSRILFNTWSASCSGNATLACLKHPVERLTWGPRKGIILLSTLPMKIETLFELVKLSPYLIFIYMPY